MDPTKPYIRRMDLARKLGVSLRTLDRWVYEGFCGVKLRSFKFGRSVAFQWGDVEAFRKATTGKPMTGKPPSSTTKHKENGNAH